MAIALAACLLYANSFPNAFVFDDLELIPHHPALRNPAHLGAVLGSGYWDGLRERDTLYRPLTIWTLALNWGANRALGLPGEDPRGYHVVNILLHALASLLVFRFMRSLGVGTWAAGAAGLLFAAHPIHSEVVDSAVYRSESLAAVFGLLFLDFVRGRRALPAAVAFFLALASKESAVAYLPLALWMEITLRRIETPEPRPRGAAHSRDEESAPMAASRRRGRLLFVYSAAVLAAVVWLALRAGAVGGIRQWTHPVDNPLAGTGLAARFITAGAVQLRYLALQLAPVRLSSDYSYAQIPVVKSLADPRFLGFVLAAALAAVAAWRLRRISPAATFALGGYAILFAPAANFLFPTGTIMAERLAYSPSALLCLLAALALERLRRAAARAAVPWAVVVVVAAALVACGAATFARNGTWRDADVFYATQVRTAPESAKAHYSHGKRLQLAGDLAGAITHYRRALEILPDYPDALNNLGTALEKQGDRAGAKALYERAITLNPAHGQAWFNLGRLAQLGGDRTAAAEAYRAAIRYEPENPDPYNNLGILYADAGDLAGAEAVWRQGLARCPNDPALRQNLALLEAARGGGR